MRPRRSLPIKVLAVTATIAASIVGVGIAPATAQPVGTSPFQSSPDSGSGSQFAPSVPEGQRNATIGPDWQNNDDFAVTSTSTAAGFALLVAKASEGYRWSTIASLSVPGMEADSWVGNYCLTADGTKAAAVFAPRTFSNDEKSFYEGAFGAIVDIGSGQVTELGQGYSLAYFNPGCGAGNLTTFSRFADNSTYVGVLDASTGKAVKSLHTDSIVTSATVSSAGDVVASSGAGIEKVADDGKKTLISPTTGDAYGLQMGPNDTVTYLVADGEQANVQSVGLTSKQATAARNLGSGKLQDLTTSRDATGRVAIIGSLSTKAKALTNPEYLLVPGGNRSSLSSRGELVVSPPEKQEADGETSLGESQPLKIVSKSLKTGKDVVVGGSVSAVPRTSTGASGHGMGVGSGRVIMGSASDPGEAERTCAVSRNDPHNQVLQPKPRQVEWAVDRAVAGELTIQRPANWNNLGLAAYTPQGLFPKLTLQGGGRIPAQIVLGVLAQESNLKQATALANPGETGNPLVGRYYGNSGGFGDNAFWNVNWADADCGYGVGQITDGMEVSDTIYSATQQRAIALDYTANVARAVQMLTEKWNETRLAGVTINNGNPSMIENWYAAVWAYNSGFHANYDGAGPLWGLGWTNNPMNKMYIPSRHSFLNGNAADASHPQDWSYPEKVVGFAAWSLDLPEKAVTSATGVSITTVSGFRTAWWSDYGAGGPTNRTQAQAPRTTFCTLADNNCNPLAASGTEACQTAGLYCWWHRNATWKTDCNNTCGNETYRFSPAADYMAEQANGESFPPACSSSGLPSGALVIDDIPMVVDGQVRSQAPVRPGCSAVPTVGNFAFNFGQPLSNGSYAAKVDLHQLGSGFNGHFYFTHTRDDTQLPAARITGTWSLGRNLNQWARVMVHVPDHAAWSQQAMYTIDRGNGQKETRALLQRTNANTWVSLGVFLMAGQPSVSLSNRTWDGNAIDDIAWDAAAILPLAQKPADFIVSLGDSYSSGEGASDLDGPNWSYEFNSNNNGATKQYQNACHRSRDAWSRKAAVHGTPTVGAREAGLYDNLDYHMLACSGAETRNILAQHTSATTPAAAIKGQYHELTQIDQGYLDENTTLVTISVGGNDIGFADVVKTCVEGPCEMTLAQMTDVIDNTMAPAVTNVLEQIHGRAPNAKILLMGYPDLFEGFGLCVGIGYGSNDFLQGSSAALSTRLAAIAASFSAGVGAGSTKYADPAPAFSEHELCDTDTGINGLVFSLSPGETPPGLPWPAQSLGISSQSIHPNERGTDLYAATMEAALAGFY